MPTQWTDFGKKTKDLFTKKYDFKHELKAVSKTEDGITIELGVAGKTTAGFVKLSAKRELGEGEVEFFSDPAKGDKAKFKLDKAIKNVAVTVNASSLDTFGVEVAVEQGSLAGKAEYKHSDRSTLGLSASWKAIKDSILGVSTDFEVKGGEVALKDWNLGVETQYQDTTVSVRTDQQRQDLVLSVFHKASPDLQVGTKLILQPTSAKLTPSLVAGVEYNLSPVTTVKGRTNSTGVVGFAIEHRLKNPSVKLNVANEFDISKPHTTETRKFGVALAIGDY